MRTSILGVVVSAAVGSFAFFSVASPAEAASVRISASGEWGPDTESIKGFSAPGASFSFSFDLPNPISSNPTEGTHFDYALNDKGVIDEFLSPFVPVQFFTAAEAGMFDLFPKKMTDGEPVVVSLYGPDIGSSLTIVTGLNIAVTAGMQRLPSTGSGTVTVSSLGVTGFGGGVPESSTWVMMILGFAGLAFAGYRTRPAHRAKPVDPDLIQPDQALAPLVGLGLDGHRP
jgi:hypothetical protein